MRGSSNLFGWPDLARLAVLGALVTYLIANKSVLEGRRSEVHVDPDQPRITSIKEGDKVQAGLTTIKGLGADGQAIEILENGRLVGIGQSKDNSWSITGKLLGPGQSKVFARAVGGKARQSPSIGIFIEGTAQRTLFITNPIDADYIVPGRMMLKGRGKPGDEIMLFYNRTVIAKTVPNSDGVWWKAVFIERPTQSGEFRAASRSEGEFVSVYVWGSR